MVGKQEQEVSFVSGLKKRVITLGAVAVLCACGGASFINEAGLVTQKPTPDVSDNYEFPARYSTVAGHYLSAAVARGEGDEKEALSYLNEAIGLGSSNKDLYVDAYTLALESGDIGLAEHFAGKISDYSEDVIISPKLLQAVVALKKGDYATAENKLGQAPESGFGQLVLTLLKSWVLEAQGKPVPKEDLQALIQEGGEFELLMKYQLALLFEAMGNERASYFHELAAKPYLPHHMTLELLQHYQRLGDDRQIHKILSRYEGEVGLQFPQGGVAQPVLTPQQGAAEVFYGVASLLISVDALEAAKVPLYLASYLHPDFASVDFLQAQLAEKSGDTIVAIEKYKALEQDENYGLMASLQLAYLYQEVNQPQFALEKIESLLVTHPNNLNIWLAKGDILRNELKYEESAQAYTAAIETIKEKRAEHWPAFYSRAIAYERAGQWDRAEADFLEALRLQPDQPDVLNYLGYSWLIQNRHLSQAKSMIQKAMMARPRDAHIIDSMGWALYRLGDYDKAVAYLERAVDLSPGDATVNEHLGDVYWRIGRTIQAKYQWERALAFNPTEPGQEEGLRGKIASGLPAADVPKSDVMQAGALKDKTDLQRAEIPAVEEKTAQ